MGRTSDFLRPVTAAIAVLLCTAATTSAQQPANPGVATKSPDKPKTHGQWLGATVKSRDPQIIIAEHVLLTDNQIVTWEQLVNQFKKRRAAGPFRAEFYFTNSVARKKKQGWQFWHDRIMELYHDDFEPVGVTFGSINPRKSELFDKVRSEADLVPDPARKKIGIVLGLDGKPVDGAQVVVVPDKAVMPVMLNGFELRDPLDEQWEWSDKAGKFAVFPETGDWWIAAIHPTGFVCQRGSDKDAHLKLQLQPWAVLTLSSTGGVAAGQSVSITDRPDPRPGAPQFNTYSLKVTVDPIQIRIPAGRIDIQRDLEMDRGTSISTSVEAITLQPGERRTISVAAADKAARTKAKELFEDLESDRKGDNKAENAAKPRSKSGPPTKPADQNKALASKKPAATSGSNVSRRPREESVEAALLLAQLSADSRYHLANNEAMRRIAPPFPTARSEWYRAAYDRDDEIPAMVIKWSGGRLVPGESCTTDDSGIDIQLLLDSIFAKTPQWVEAPPGFLETHILGDWVVRKGASDDQRLAALAGILRNELSTPMKMEFRTVHWPVYVASGTFQLKPLRPNINWLGSILIFAKDLAANEEGDSGGICDYAYFLQILGRRIGSPILSDVKSPPKRHFPWKLCHQTANTKQSSAEDCNPALVLPNITAQTGLEFHTETRPVRILFINRAK